MWCGVCVKDGRDERVMTTNQFLVSCLAYCRSSLIFYIISESLHNRGRPNKL